jgi:hypothetical protein
MLKDASRRKFDVVMVWAIGRRLRRAACKPNWPSIHFDQGQLPPQFRWTTIDCPNIEPAGTIVVD